MGEQNFPGGGDFSLWKLPFMYIAKRKQNSKENVVNYVIFEKNYLKKWFKHNSCIWIFVFCKNDSIFFYNSTFHKITKKKEFDAGFQWVIWEKKKFLQNSFEKN